MVMVLVVMILIEYVSHIIPPKVDIYNNLSVNYRVF